MQTASFIPISDAASVTEGDKPAAKADGVKLHGVEKGHSIFQIGSGTYHFTQEERKVGDR